MKAIFILAFLILSAFSSSEKLIDIHLIERKWELVKTMNFNDKSVYHESGNIFITFRDKEFTFFSKENKTVELNKGTWEYIEESQTLSCQIDNQDLIYKLIKLTEQTLIIQHNDFNSEDRIQEEFISVK